MCFMWPQRLQPVSSIHTFEKYSNVCAWQCARKVRTTSSTSQVRALLECLPHLSWRLCAKRASKYCTWWIQLMSTWTPEKSKIFGFTNCLAKHYLYQNLKTKNHDFFFGGLFFSFSSSWVGVRQKLVSRCIPV